MNGFYNVLKPIGFSSSDLVVKIRGILRRQTGGKPKIGHLGTLDPLATGVLGVAVGSATKLFDCFLKKRKTYVATCFLGKETDTLDSAGKIVSEGAVPQLSDCELESILESFVGEITQIPPLYSAKSIGGVRAYKLAHKGISAELKPCDVTIYRMKLLDRESPNVFRFEVECSGGTYIRSLCRDVGQKIGCPAYMAALTRTKNGDMTIENAVDIHEIEEDTGRGFTSLETYAASLKTADFSEEFRKRIENGVKVKCDGDDGLVSVRIGGLFYAVGRILSGELWIIARNI